MLKKLKIFLTRLKLGSLRRTRKHWRIKSRVNVCEVGKVKTESEEFRYEVFKENKAVNT